MPRSHLEIVPEGDRNGTRPLAEQVAERIRRDILLNKLKPGDPLKERDAAAEMGVSRTPMREAIRILAAEGLLTLRHARSPIVANPSLKEILDNVAVMCALEVLSGRLACLNATEIELEDIAALHRRMIEISDVVDAVDFFVVDMSFHRAIAQASHNKPLFETHQAFNARLWRPRFLSASIKRDRDRVLREHEQVAEALVARDQAALAPVLDRHLRHLIRNVTEIYEGTSDPQALLSGVGTTVPQPGGDTA